MTLISPSDPLTPSEIVMLHGEKFIRKTRFTSVKLPHKDAKVAIDDLIQTMLSAAILANEQVGVLKLVAGHKKVLGRQRDTLYVRLVGPIPDWPANSIEAKMCEQATLLLSDVGREAHGLIYAWLEQHYRNIWYGVFYRVRRILVDRGLLETVNIRKFGILPATDYALSASARELVEQHPIEPTMYLLAECEGERPQVWKMLWDHIKHGFVRRGRYHHQ
jgi:hypothetical protein